jgi:hypothetical protein
VWSGLFVAEGSSDAPLADLVTGLFRARGVSVQLARPDFSLLDERVPRDVASRVAAGRTLMEGRAVDLVVVHRDVDSATPSDRLLEVQEALHAAGVDAPLVPVLPVRMTEAWLLLDEAAIRTVAGNPRGRQVLSLPKVHEVERLADPKARLRETLMAAADVRGRRRSRLDRRFDSHRRQLLERLDPTGPVTHLSSWVALVADVDGTTTQLGPRGPT